MKIKNMILSCVLILSGILLTACGNKQVKIPKNLKAFEVNYVNHPVYKDVVKLDSISGNYIEQEGNLIHFSKFDFESGYNIHYIYNLKTNQVVEYSENMDYSINKIEMASINGVALYSVVREMTDPTENHYWTLVYDENGTNLGTFAKYLNMYRTCDLVFIGEVSYSEKNGKIVNKSVRNNLLEQYPEFDYRIGDFYYEEVQSNKLVIYNCDGSIIQSVIAPTYANNVTIFPIATGDVLMQYTYKVPNESIDYDLYLNNQKYKVVTSLTNASTGKVTKLSTDFLFDEGYALNEVSEYTNGITGLNKKVKTIATAYIIDSNKQIDSSVKGEYVVSISNKGNVEKVLNCYVEDQGFNFPAVVAKNRFIVENEWERTYCFDEKGKILREITNAQYYTDSYFITEDNEVYNWHFDKIYDINDNNASFVKATDNFVLLSRNGSYFFLDKDGNEVSISSNENQKLFYNWDSTNDCLFFHNSNGEYEYYNSNGQMFYQGSVILNKLCTSTDSKKVLFNYGSEYYLATLE